MSRDNVVMAGGAPPPVGAYPHARRFGNLLFLSGVGPRQPDTTEIPGVTRNAEGHVIAHDVKVQTRATIENVKRILAAAGSDISRIIDVTVYLTDMENDFRGYNEVWAEYFTAIQATRTTVGITALPTPIAVEFKVIAEAP